MTKTLVEWAEWRVGLNSVTAVEMIAWLWALEDVLEAPPVIGEYDIDGRQPYLHEWHQAICEGLHDPACR